MIKNKDERLGVNGLKDILKHEFFKDLHIEALMNKVIVPSYLPEIKNFDYFPKIEI